MAYIALLGVKTSIIGFFRFPERIAPRHFMNAPAQCSGTQFCFYSFYKLFAACRGMQCLFALAAAGPISQFLTLKTS